MKTIEVVGAILLAASTYVLWWLYIRHMMKAAIQEFKNTFSVEEDEEVFCFDHFMFEPNILHLLVFNNLPDDEFERLVKVFGDSIGDNYKIIILNKK